MPVARITPRLSTGNTPNDNYRDFYLGLYQGGLAADNDYGTVDWYGMKILYWVDPYPRCPSGQRNTVQDTSSDIIAMLLL